MVVIDSCSTSLKRRIHRFLGSRVEMVWVRGSELDPILGDCEWIEQVIIDMAIRARAALPYGGRLLIESANIDLDPYCAAAEGLESGRYVMIEMTSLRRTPSVVGSSCVDMTTPELFIDGSLDDLLAASKEILRSLGGNVCEYNEPGRALTLRAFFPSAATVIYSDNEDLHLSTSNTQETILLVEDEGFVRDVACEILESAGYKVICARGGAEALASFEKHGPVKLLVTDVVMPGINGRELSLKLTALQPDLKTIYMSGYMDNAVLRRDLALSDVAYIQKPFTLETLTTKVKEVLADATMESV